MVAVVGLCAVGLTNSRRARPLARRLLERVGPQTLLVDRQALQAQAQALGDVAHAGVGQALDQDRSPGRASAANAVTIA